MPKNSKLVQVEKTTYDKLVSLGSKQDTFNSIICRLIKQNESLGLGTPSEK